LNVKKPIFLFLALLLPIAVFLFLKFFGKNEFAVEPLFQHEIQIPEKCEGTEYTAPYTISDSVFTALHEVSDSVTLVIFSDLPLEKQQEQTIQLGRVLKEFAIDHVGVVMITSDSILNRPKSEKIRVKILENEEVAVVHNCVMLMPLEMDAVIFDNEKRIVGQYMLHAREDSDRLILEMMILLGKY